MFRCFHLNKLHSDGELSFRDLIDELADLTKKNLLEKPFKNDNDLEKHLFFLRKLGLIEHNGNKRKYTFNLTQKCRNSLVRLNHEYLKFILIEKIKVAPGRLIAYNFNRIIDII